ncbi:MAG: hypothetical protein IT205_09505 [Fimbriimonadaceae bacterium]|nr:hypothetical protein [Fimbriimonadaceae bacterium]
MLEYVYKAHRKTGASVRDVFISIYEHLGKTVVNDMVRNRDHSWNNIRNFPGSSVFSEIATASFITFLLLNVALAIILPNEGFSWSTFAAYTVVSTIITWSFAKETGKNERKYYNAVHNVQQAQLSVESKGFRDHSGRAFSFVDEAPDTDIRL